LVKYADPSAYEIETRRALRQAAVELMGRTQVAPSKLVDLLDEEPMEVELATTLLYEHCPYPYRQVRQAIQAAGEKMRREIVDLGLRHRGEHDEMLRAYCAGQQFRFDILMDIVAPRPAPPPPLYSDRPGIHDQTRIRPTSRTRSRRGAARLRRGHETGGGRRRSARAAAGR